MFVKHSNVLFEKNFGKDYKISDGSTTQAWAHLSGGSGVAHRHDDIEEVISIMVQQRKCKRLKIRRANTVYYPDN